MLRRLPAGRLAVAAPSAHPRTSAALTGASPSAFAQQRAFSRTPQRAFTRTAALNKAPASMRNQTKHGTKTFKVLKPPSGFHRAAFKAYDGARMIAKAASLNRRIAKAVTGVDVVTALSVFGEDTSPINFATALHRLGSLGRRTAGTAPAETMHDVVHKTTLSILHQPRKWPPRDLASACWGVAKMRITRAPEFFDAAAAAAKGTIDDFSALDLANTLWAFSTVGYADAELFRVAALQTEKVLGNLKPQEISNVAWAFAKAQLENPRLFQALALESMSKVEAFTPQALANTAWAFSTVGVHHAVLFEKLGLRAAYTIKDFETQHLSNMAWAFAKAGLWHKPVFDCVSVESVNKMNACTPQSLANTLWAFAASAESIKSYAALFDAVAQRLAKSGLRDLSPENLSQLHQVLVLLRLELPRHSLTVLLQAHSNLLREAYVRIEPMHSESQKNVSAALTRIGWVHDFEHATEEGFRLDMAQPSDLLAVEFDGPSHFLAQAGFERRILDGKSKFKSNLLTKLGWTVLRIPFFEWDSLNPEEQGDYLKNALAEALPKQKRAYDDMDTRDLKVRGWEPGRCRVAKDSGGGPAYGSLRRPDVARRGARGGARASESPLKLIRRGFDPGLGHSLWASRDSWQRAA